MAAHEDAFQQWSIAHQAACAAEMRVHAATLEFAAGRGDPPSREMIEDAKVKRALASQASREMIAANHERAERCRPRAEQNGSGASAAQ
jgi:hypothetical protein